MSLIRKAAEAAICLAAATTVQAFLPVAHAGPLPPCTPDQIGTGAYYNQCQAPGCPVWNYNAYINCVGTQLAPNYQQPDTTFHSPEGPGRLKGYQTNAYHMDPAPPSPTPYPAFCFAPLLRVTHLTECGFNADGSYAQPTTPPTLPH